MYPRLGLIELTPIDVGCDVFGNQGLMPGDPGWDPSCGPQVVFNADPINPIAMTPDVQTTIVPPGPPQPAPILIQPVSVPATQQLPAPVSGPSSSDLWGVAALLAGLFALTRGKGRGSISW